MARVEATLSAPEAPVLQLARTLLWGFTRVFSILLLLAAWEILARSGAFTHFQLPAFSEVVGRIWSDAWAGDLWINTALTLIIMACAVTIPNPATSAPMIIQTVSVFIMVLLGLG